MTPQSNAADDAKIMYNLTIAKLYAFDLNNHGFFFWNFRTELEPRWDFSRAVAMGWIPPLIRNDSTVDDQMKYVCEVMYPAVQPDASKDQTWVLAWVSVFCVSFGLLMWSVLACYTSTGAGGAFSSRKFNEYEQVIDMAPVHSAETKAGPVIGII